MKTFKKLVLLALLSFVFISKTSAELIKTPAFENAIADDGKIKLNLIKQDWKIDVEVSFNGDEGQTGKLKIYNSKKQFITEFDIELKKSPDYYSINLNEFASDEYTFELKTSSGLHTTTLTIK